MVWKNVRVRALYDYEESCVKENRFVFFFFFFLLLFFALISVQENIQSQKDTKRNKPILTALIGH